MDVLTNLQLNRNQILSFVVHNSDVPPSKPKQGQMYYDTINKVIKVWNGTEWLAGGVPKAPELTIENISGLKTQLDNKVNRSQVQTDVPVGAVFTDTITTINGKTGAITKSDITSLGIPGQDTVTTINGKTGAIKKEDIVALGIPAQDTNTTYRVFTPTDDGLVPKSVDAGTTKYLRADGTWATPPDTNTTYTKESLGLGNVDNTSDMDKPISLAVKEALANKASKKEAETLSSTAENNSKTYTDKKITELIGGSPAILDTLKEIADALGNDPNFAETMINELSKKAEMFTEVIGDGNSKEFTIKHPHNTRDLTITIRETQAPYAVVYTDIYMPTTDTLKVKFNEPPKKDQYTVTVLG